MFFFLSKILDVLLSPLVWALGLVAIALPWRRRPMVERFGRRRACGIAGVALLLVASMAPVSNGLMYRLEHSTTPTYRPDVTYDTVILLGGVSDERTVSETGQPAYNDNVERLVMTRRLLADGHARTAIVSGAAEDPSLAEFGEAHVLVDQLVEWGIDRSRLISEDRARNTHENALFSTAIVKERGFTKVLIVTSAFHMRRAAECFTAVGLEVDTFPVDYRAHRRPMWSLLPRAGNLADTSATLREMFGLWIYRARGYAK